MTFDQWMHASLDRVETALEHYLPGTDIAPAKLHEAMRYAVLGGGKRVRLRPRSMPQARRLR
jgi:farnesyl diphosphate synthase